MYESSLFPEIEYTFKHVLTQEVAYDSLLIDRRRALHARILEAIEGFSGDRLASEVEHLAHHAFRGEVWDKAAWYMRQAGTRSLARSASREAAGLFEQALTALEHLPADRARVEEAIDVRLDLRQALVALADRSRILDHMQKAESMARSLGDQRRLSWSAYARRIITISRASRSDGQGRAARPRAERWQRCGARRRRQLLGYSFHMTGDHSADAAG
jgi:predicted ATPase